MTYRIAFIVLFGAAFAVAATHRLRAQQERGTVSEKTENRVLYILLRGGGLLLWGSAIAYMLNPNWLAWATLPLPAVVRWTGAGVAAVGVVLAGAAARAIGSNVTRTVVTRNDHQLVTSGPYRYIRHPLYTAGLLLFVGLGLLAANIVILVLGVLAIVLVTLRLPQEEHHLIERFGDDYRDYMRATGRYLPRIGANRV